MSILLNYFVTKTIGMLFVALWEVYCSLGVACASCKALFIIMNLMYFILFSVETSSHDYHYAGDSRKVVATEIVRQ